MFQPLLAETEVIYRHRQVQTTYIEAQRQVSVSGIRQIIGNTILELGSRIHGMAQAACPSAAESRGLVRNAMRAPYTYDLKPHATHPHQA